MNTIRTLTVSALAVGLACAQSQPTSAQEAPKDTMYPAAKVKLRRLPFRTDTTNTQAVMPDGSSPGTGTSVIARTRLVENRDTLIRVVLQTGPNGVDVYTMDFTYPTLAPRRFRQKTARDSAAVDIDASGHVTGWVHPANEARRAVGAHLPGIGFITITDDAIAALPLRSGYDVALRSYSPWFEAKATRVRVVGEETLSYHGESVHVWRVENVSVTDWGTVVRNLWIDQGQARILRTEAVLPNGRKIITTLR